MLSSLAVEILELFYYFIQENKQTNQPNQPTNQTAKPKTPSDTKAMAHYLPPTGQCQSPSNSHLGKAPLSSTQL